MKSPRRCSVCHGRPDAGCHRGPPDDCAGIPGRHRMALLGRLDCPGDDLPAANLLLDILIGHGLDGPSTTPWTWATT